MSPARSLPEELRVHDASARLEAAGRRAFASEAAARDALEVVIDGKRALIELDPPLDDGDVHVWPFAAAREAGSAFHLLFAAADQPAIMLELRRVTSPVRMRLAEADTGVTVGASGAPLGRDWRTPAPDAEGCIRLVAHAGPAPDMDALLGGAIARARRRAAQRPFVRRPSDSHDIVGSYDRALRLELAAGAELDAARCVLASMALLALNDAAGALDLLREREPAIATGSSYARVAAGAWAAWRGEAIPLAAVRDMLKGERPRTPDTDVAWRDAAAAHAPYVADLLGVDAGPKGEQPLDPAQAIVSVARAVGAPRAAVALLELIHGELGIMPDAGRGRVRIAPRLVAGTTEISRIAAGEALLSFRADVGAGDASIKVEQTSGATPLTVILEPGVPGERLSSALVEDTPAELDTVLVAGALRARVQLVIDRRRTLVLHFERR